MFRRQPATRHPGADAGGVQWNQPPAQAQDGEREPPEEAQGAGKAVRRKNLDGHVRAVMDEIAADAGHLMQTAPRPIELSEREDRDRRIQRGRHGAERECDDPPRNGSRAGKETGHGKGAAMPSPSAR